MDELENLAMDSGKKILGLNVSKRKCGWAKKGEKEKEKECGSEFTQSMVFQGGQGVEKMKKGKVERR